MNASAPSCERGPECAAYVLRALDPPEAEAHRAHVAECPSCRAEVAELQLAADALALGVPRRDAPAELRGRVMSPVYTEAGAVRAPAEASAAQARAGEAGAGEGAATRVGGHARGRGLPRPGGRSPWAAGRRLRPALAGALAVGIGIAIGALAFGSSSTRERTESIRAIVAIPGHHATAVLRKAGSHLELVVFGMPAPPAGRIYEVWLEYGAAAAPQPTDALFSVTKTGAGAVGVPGQQRGLSKVLVTDEPLGGSPKPTRTPVIVGSV